MLNSSPNTSGSDPARSSSTGSTSSGFSSDIHRYHFDNDRDDHDDRDGSWSWLSSLWSRQSNMLFFFSHILTTVSPACSPRNLQNPLCPPSAASPPPPILCPPPPPGHPSPSTSFKTGTRPPGSKKGALTHQVFTFLAPQLSVAARVRSTRRGWRVCWTRTRIATRTPDFPVWTQVLMISSSLTLSSKDSL